MRWPGSACVGALLRPDARVRELNGWRPWPPRGCGGSAGCRARLCGGGARACHRVLVGSGCAQAVRALSATSGSLRAGAGRRVM